MASLSDYSILAQLVEGCQIIGHSGRYLYINDAAAEQAHQPKEARLGERYCDVWPCVGAPELGETIRRCLENRIALKSEIASIALDGVRAWFSLSVEPVPEGALLLSSDITDCKRATQELEERYGEKEKRAAELAAANAELAFQEREKEKRATELAAANVELAFQNREKEKRATELVAANEQTNRSLQHIQSLRRIDQAIAGCLDLDLTLSIVLDQIRSQLSVDAAAVLLFNPHTQLFEFAAGVGFRGKAVERSRLRTGEGHGGRAAADRTTVSVTDLRADSARFTRSALLAEEGFASYFATPLIAKGQVNGILDVFHRLPLSPTAEWLDFFTILAGQAAIAVDSASLFADLKQSHAQLFAAYDSTIEGWSHALDLRDKETEGHTQRVTEMTVALARAAGMSEGEIVHVRRGALLHDIGKMGVPDHILLKPGKLTEEEWVTMRKHPAFAFELLSPIAYLRPALDIPYCHHEKWDGGGYPRGLKGDQIPLAVQLFTIVDVWDALRSDRPYRPSWPQEKVIAHLQSLSGTHFNPKALDLFLSVLVSDRPLIPLPTEIPQVTR